jgi:predicted dinucleotide-binding enzyme
MEIGILGSGNIGGNLARLFARAGHHVRIANSRGPESLRALAESIGPNVEGATAQDAVDGADLVVIAIPWTKREEVLGETGPYDSKIVVDAMNAYTEDFEIDDLGRRTSSEVTRALVPGALRFRSLPTIRPRSASSWTSSTRSASTRSTTTGWSSAGGPSSPARPSTISLSAPPN